MNSALRRNVRSSWSNNSAGQPRVLTTPVADKDRSLPLLLPPVLAEQVVLGAAEFGVSVGRLLAFHSTIGARGLRSMSSAWLAGSRLAASNVGAAQRE